MLFLPLQWNVWKHSINPKEEKYKIRNGQKYAKNHKFFVQNYKKRKRAASETMRPAGMALYFSSFALHLERKRSLWMMARVWVP
jgi:hypothetical protein